MALKVFTSCRGALEVTRGTDLTPTRLWYGEEFGWDQTFKTIRPKTLNNSYEQYPNATPGVETNTFSWSGRLSFNMSLLLGNMFFGPLLTGVGGAADKTYTFPISNTLDNVKTATVELGYADTIATAPAVELNYVFPQSLNLHWEKNDDGAVLFNATFLTALAAEQITAFTGALSDIAQVDLSSNGTTVYIDTATIGTTAAPEVRAVDWTLDLGPVAFYGLNGSTAATAVYRPEGRVWSATIERQYTNDAEWDIYQSKAARKIRIKTVGPALGGGTYLHQLDLYGVYDEPRTMSDVDGIITENLTFVQKTDTGIAGSMSHVVVSSEATIS